MLRPTDPSVFRLRVEINPSPTTFAATRAGCAWIALSNDRFQAASLYFRSWPVSDRTESPTGHRSLDFGLFSHLQCIVDLDSEVANCTFQLRVSKQQLHCRRFFVRL